MSSYLDDKVGRIMAALHDMDLIDDTIVVFTSDHGEMLGERGMWFKQSFYENSTRVPLIISHPGHIDQGRVSEITSLMDLLPTFVDWGTGGDAPDPVSVLDGHSLTGLLSGNGEAWDNAVISEYTGEGVVAPCRMIRRDNFKYIYTHGHPPLLYDMDADPLEMNNLAGDADVADIKAKLHAELMNGWNPDKIAAQCIQSQKERLFIHGTTKGAPTWAHVSRAGDDRKYVRNDSAVGTKARARYPYVEPTPFER